MDFQSSSALSPSGKAAVSLVVVVVAAAGQAVAVCEDAAEPQSRISPENSSSISAEMS